MVSSIGKRTASGVNPGARVGIWEFKGQSLFGARNMRFMIRKCNLLQRKEAGQPPIKLMRRSCRGAEMWERRCPKCSTKLQKKNPADTVRCNCRYEWK